VTIYLVRHAQAGNRSDWSGDDESRPLTREGRHQAADLVEMLGEVELDEIHSSPYLRCVETVAPLSARRSREGVGLITHIHQALTEGSPLDAIALVRSLASTKTHAVLCSHGDIIPGVLEALVRDDHLDLGPAPKCQKASIWVLEPDGSRFTHALYVPPPR
jgi:phosphohistidine phosphatase SixA